MHRPASMSQCHIASPFYGTGLDGTQSETALSRLWCTQDPPVLTHNYDYVHPTVCQVSSAAAHTFISII